ncbi:hypothetical protein C5E45_29725 [Nocardia nova]|uniref:Uncharacterized protein n=1 Tax=Nocardia nova TaxID=37330 RepID=A0A2S6AHH0_9NOCA|nr:hypothetical protein [Nocardia nova]PPJ22173.1 hypothetical protein C5E41_27965 [Nocardia nova]PPJ34675.1 hypothetical protein C5E45_29725 [Nocardia nova]
MRIVSTACHLFGYEVTAAGPCAVALNPAAVRARKLFVDCLVLQIAVEPGDAAVLPAAVEVVKTIALHNDARYIVVESVAPWARTDRRAGGGDPDDVLTGLADALDVVSELTERLEERGELVHLIPFGWNTIRFTELAGGSRPRRVTRLNPAPLPADRSRHSRAPRIAGSCRSLSY